jgi:hypothetical protein
VLQRRVNLRDKIPSQLLPDHLSAFEAVQRDHDSVARLILYACWARVCYRAHSAQASRPLELIKDVRSEVRVKAYASILVQQGMMKEPTRIPAVILL